MTSKNIVLFIAVLTIAIGVYFLFTINTTPNQATVMQDTEEEQVIAYCDGNGNRYNSPAEAQAAGLTEAEYGATFCSEYVAMQTGDYTGLRVDQAEVIAQARSELFRVIEVDGIAQPTTRDFQEGRINARVADGAVISFMIESSITTNPEDEAESGNLNDMILGMTVAEAEMYAKANNVDFRTGTVDGVSLPLTADFRVGRITAEIQDGIVLSYTVE